MVMREWLKLSKSCLPKVKMGGKIETNLPSFADELAHVANGIDETKSRILIMDVPVKNIYVYEAFPSNSIKLETEDDTTKETLLLILPHHPIEDDITPVCESESLQVKEEPINNGCDNFDEVTDPLVSEGTYLIKLEDHKIKNEAESEILLNDDVSPQVNPNMKSNELRIKDFHTVKTKDGMVFYPCRVIIDKLTITASTNNFKRCVNNSVYGGIIKQKTSECKCANGDLRTENLVKDISNENELPQHKGKKLVCEYCNERFSCKCYLKRHVNCHAKEKENNSNSCQKSLILENKLKTQLITHNEEKNYVCNFCQRSFNRKDSLKLHLNIHTKEKNYICNICQKSFNHKRNLKTHLNIHTKEKNYISNTLPPERTIKDRQIPEDGKKKLEELAWTKCIIKMGSGGSVPNKIMYKELEPITDMHKRLGFFRHNHEDAVFKTSETANAVQSRLGKYKGRMQMIRRNKIGSEGNWHYISRCHRYDKIK
ncbi:uncharacterized protein LOC142317888 [Lycorma delicatula]|uniref:uncharacterized protein LOC142317888 n=1 Tax=Lycorma delicatula TaxID=130591 RepID=UPI003F50EFD9